MKKVLLVLVCVLIVSLSFADVPATTPIKFSLFDKIAIPEKNDVVSGLEVGISSYTHKLKGLSWNFIFSKTDEGLGVQKSFVTLTKSFVGLQAGVINLSSNEICGLQCGFFNKAKSVSGFQLGLVNMTEDLYGIQVGLINFIENGYFPTMIIANAKF
ncbi:MAG: hypothetical protein Nk1A_2000 [Endomicrobiia bacterium]|nr:MAG: hypothetical protein Nk1A_2000 [Endomicrobiia bacterium]